MHYYQFNIKAYHAATAHLSPSEDLAYRRFIDHYMDTEQPIPDDFAKVARRLRISEDAAQAVLLEFFISTPDGWRNEKCDAQIAAYHAQSERNAINGKKGGRPRKNPVALQDGKKAKKSERLGSLSKNNRPVSRSEKQRAEKHVNGAEITHTDETENAVEPCGSKGKTHSQPTGKRPESQLVIINNKQITNKNNKPSAVASGRSRATGVDGLMELGVSEQVAFDYLAVRKAKRSPLTQTALDQLQREADKAGITIAEAITISTGNSWVGFKAEWLNKPEVKSFIAQHTDREWRESFIAKHTDRSWAEGLEI